MRPDSPEGQAFLAQQLTNELGFPLRWFYLSFASEVRFLGGVLVEAPGEFHAIKKTHDLGINPGGEVCIFAVPDTETIPEAAKNRLLSMRELETLIGPVSQPFKDDPVLPKDGK